MALNITTTPVAQAFETLLQKATTLKGNVQTVRTTLATTNTPADTVINIMRHIQVARDVIASAKAAAGLNAYAQEQFNDPAVDVVAEADAVIAACNGVLTWTATNFPKDASGYLLKDKIANGTIENRVFTPAAMAGLVTQLDPLLATFE